jgi:hypothetical protein
MDRLRAADVEVTSDWLEVIAANGVANPRGDDKHSIRRSAALGNKQAIKRADILWMLVPEDAPGRGAYYEAGVADVLGKHLVFSGDCDQSVFCATGAEFDNDDAAFDHVVAYARHSL